MLLNIAAFVVVVGVLILVHEAGHFFAAKALGVQVLRFALGFGPPILKTKRGETEYWLCAVPLGGYVKMAGLEDEGMAGELEGGRSETPVDAARAFDRKPIWARLIIMVAGVAMNVVLAYVVFATVGLAYGRAEEGTTVVDSVIVADLPAEAQATAATLPGNRLTAVNGASMGSWNDVVEALVLARDSVRFEFEGGGSATIPVADSAAATVLAGALIPAWPAKVAEVQARPARTAGIRRGDVVLRAGDDTVRSWGRFVRLVRASPGQPIPLVLDRNGERLSVTVTPAEQTTTDSSGATITFGSIGVAVVQPIVYERQSFGEAVTGAGRLTLRSAVAISVYVGRLFAGRESMRDLGGPILIGQTSGQMVRLGLDKFLWFLAFFSVQLAVLNMLPIPVLDGGHVVFLLAEAVRGKPVSLVWRIRLLNVGFVLLMMLMVFAFGNDVLRLFR